MPPEPLPRDATPQPTPIAGLLVIDKPKGPTSMHVCRLVRRRLVNAGQPKRIKVGHGGTLDPLATGVLVVLVGRATRLCDAVMAGEKRYTAAVDLAHRSATDDHEGALEPVHVDEPPTAGDLRRALTAFIGDIQQIPPTYSAVKVAGRRAYAAARKGHEVTLKPRTVTVHSIELLDYTWPVATLDIRCGKGTYIRSIARDLGAALGTGGCLAGLRRTAVGRFTIDQALPLDDVPDPLSPESLLPVPAEL